MSRKNRTPEENARRAKIRELRRKPTVPSSIMRKFIYKSGRTQSAQGRETCP